MADISLARVLDYVKGFTFGFNDADVINSFSYT